MRRVLATASTVVLILGFGCSKDYDTRLSETIELLRYQKRLDENLMPPVEPRFKDLSIYLRPPKNLNPSQTFLLAIKEPEQFDLTQSFLEPEKQSLHVLARDKRPKPADKKKAAPPPVRQDFNSSVLALLAANYPNVELAMSKFKPVEKKRSSTSRVFNEFKQYPFVYESNTVEVYLLNTKEPYELALIFVYPTSEKANLTSKINLCLESLAVGNRAKAAFSGSGVEEEEAGGASAGGAVF